MLARYYSAGMGRFLSVDPGGDHFEPIDPQTWNRYAYSLNNPVKHFDPDGKDAKLAPGLSRSDEQRIVSALAQASRNPDFARTLQSVEASDKTVTYGTAELRNDFETNPGAQTGTVDVGVTNPTFDAQGQLTGAAVSLDFSNVDFSQKTTDPKTDVEAVAHETQHASNILQGVPGGAHEEAGAKKFGKDVNKDPKTKDKPTRQEKQKIKEVLK